MSARPPSEARLWLKAAVVWLLLSALLIATVALAYAPLGAAKIFVSLGIGAAKAAVVLAIFMELRSDSPIIRIAAISGPFLLLVLFALTFADETTRRHALDLFGAY